MHNDSDRRVYIVDDNSDIRRSTYFLLTTCGYRAHSFVSGQDFLDAQPTLEPGCVLLDIRMPDIDGLKLLEMRRGAMPLHPVVVMTAHGDVGVAVRAMKLGAVDFIEKPFAEAVLLETIDQAFHPLDRALAAEAERNAAAELVGQLSAREAAVLRGLRGGLSNKAIAFHLGLSVRTVEMHRAHMMDRLGVRSLSEALTIALAGGLQPLGAADADQDATGLAAAGLSRPAASAGR